jgi:hypothetical protein
VALNHLEIEAKIQRPNSEIVEAYVEQICGGFAGH